MSSSPETSQTSLLTPPNVHRARGQSIASVQSTTSSQFESPTSVSTKRQKELEKYFGDDLIALWSESDPIPADYLTVIATQSGDLQAKVLLHGRLYLTPYHLCFRSNILGYKTETIHPLNKLRSLKKGTTAKWIQNAIYIIEDEHVGEEYIGYGSLADRNAMFDSIRECWRVVCPEKHDAWMTRGSVETLVREDQGESLVDEKEKNQEGVVQASTNATAVQGAGNVETTECTGKDHFDELAIDTVVGISLDQLYELVYQNRQFIEDFYQNDKGLTELNISEWDKTPEGDSRTLSYVMHMNNSIGPSKSDCNGSETVTVSEPSKRYEIVSETQTPGIPSGKKFKIRTRTCLTSANYKGRSGCRMYCTTQCDWSSGSWLKSTITPAVIKGQKEHHQQLVKKIRSHVRAHPADFGRTEGDTDSDGQDEVELKPGMTRRGTGSSMGGATGGVSDVGGSGEVMTLGRYAREKPQELAVLALIAGLTVLILSMVLRPTIDADVVIAL